MKKKLSLVLVLLTVISVALCGCGNNKSDSAGGNGLGTDFTGEDFIATEPSAEEKAKIDSVLASFMKSYEENRPEDAHALFSKGFEGTVEDLASFFEQIRTVCKNPFVPFDSYYVSDAKISDMPIKIKHTKEDETYLEITPVSRELYCGMYVSEGEKNSYILLILLSKENNGWKIAWVNPGEFKYNGEDATAIFEKTTTLYNEGNLIGAYVYSCMLANTFRPGGYYRYEKDAEMEDMCFKLYAEIGDKFPSPLMLENTSNSEIYSVRITNDETDGIMPLFLVKTDVPTSDRDALTAEAKKIVDAIELLSPGFSKSFSHTAFSVTNDNIDENNTNPTSVESFVLTLN